MPLIIVVNSKKPGSRRFRNVKTQCVHDLTIRGCYVARRFSGHYSEEFQVIIKGTQERRKHVFLTKEVVTNV